MHAAKGHGAAKTRGKLPVLVSAMTVKGYRGALANQGQQVFEGRTGKCKPRGDKGLETGTREGDGR